MDKLLTVSEAAKIRKITRQAIYLAIRENKINAHIHSDGIMRISMDDLIRHKGQRYSRMHHSRVNGKNVYNEAIGEMSVRAAANKIGVREQKLYYAMRVGKIKYSIKGVHHVIKIQDLLEYEEKYLQKRNLVEECEKCF